MGTVVDRHLLMGLLAVQNGFVGREALLAALNVWVADKSRPLGEVLVARGALGTEARELLEALAGKLLGSDGAAAGPGLSALNSLVTLRDDLARIADADLQAGLDSLDHPICPVAAAAATLVDDPAATRFGTVGGGDPSDTRTPTNGEAVGLPYCPLPSGPRFRILRPHARGGLGEVFVAHDGELGREVALKEIQDRHADNAESRARFLLEAEVTGSLEHPGIVPVYGLGHYPDGRPYYAMRFIRGDSLQEAVERFHAPGGAAQDPRRRAVELQGLLRRFVAVCDTIAYAHSRGVLHRDLKPGNIMLGPFGETLVVDWGLAKPTGRAFADRVVPEPKAPQEALHPTVSGNSSATVAGTAVGTPQYMSPEQACGDLERLGPPTDVYSLGATFYHLLTGRAPFEDASVAQVLQQVRRGDITPPRRVNPGVPAPLEAICLKAMARDPEARYASPRDLARDIEHWLADAPVSAWREPWHDRVRRWVGRHRTAVTAAAAALIVTAFALVIQLTLQVRHHRSLEDEHRKVAFEHLRLKGAHGELRAGQRRLEELNAQLRAAIEDERREHREALRARDDARCEGAELAAIHASLPRYRAALDRLIALEESHGRPDLAAKWRLERRDLVFPAMPFQPAR
ncbi:MAG TPA: protein kinase [Isosphaeraceae bacterium]|jgi:serine/threonine-protein kinase|nr:protein kinase [Isosphaeraceae bacterium]